MKNKMSKYPSIEQFRNVIKQVQHTAQYVRTEEDGTVVVDRTAIMPVLRFKGTTKLHGSNAGLGFNFNDLESYWCQSRENIITPMKDNAGYAAYVHARKYDFFPIFQEIHSKLFHNLENFDQFSGAVIYSEWCGGNIQKGVGINGLPKMMVVFGIKLLSKNPEATANVWVSDDFIKGVIVNDPSMNLYNIFTFGEWHIDIDFNDPAAIQNTLIWYTEAVEAECPAAKYFGIENGTGEGIVYKHNSEKYQNLMFKVKGEKHSASKVKVLASVDIEKMNSIKECVETIVTENRLTQGLEYLTMNQLAHDQVNTGAFIKWVTNDCYKEEIDVITGSGLSVKEVMSGVSKKSKEWYFSKIFV